ncbi:putative taste receptor type 2 member 33 [Engystomops pustulosus]|uniref:putative taste receptor type 2 member 33 n=1 Tax=Engystomops pustulosus TaxID=76066 RepID=UPI003AFB4119
MVHICYREYEIPDNRLQSFNTPYYKMISEGLTILSLFCLIVSIGFLLNGFIIITNLFWWMKRKLIETVDLLITSLGLLWLIHLVIHMHHLGLLIFHWSLFGIDNPEYVDTVTLCVMFCSLWWGSLLCVFYCVKITNYNNRLLIRLKMNISKMVPWLLLISLVISYLSSLPYHWSVTSTYVGNGTIGGKRTMEINVDNLFIIVFSGSIIPFKIFCVAIYFIIVSLVRHTKNMSSRGSGFSDAQRDIHLRVIWSMVIFLLFYVLYFVAHITITLLMSVENSMLLLLCNFFIFAYPSLHSISFIISNKKLKSSFIFVFRLSWVEKLKHQTS